MVSHSEWIAARKQFLAKEKEFTRLRDELSRQRRELPWEKVEKHYVFEGPAAKRRWPISLTAAASSSFITSCLVPDGKKDAPAALTSPITSMA